jgi:hypothetical protein
MAPSLEEIAAVYGLTRATTILAAIRAGVTKQPGWHPSHAAGEHVAKVAEAAGTGYGDGYDQDQGLEGGPLARFWYLSADCSYTPGLIYDAETDEWQIAAWGDLVEEFDTGEDDDDPDPDPLEEFRGYQPPTGPFAKWITSVQWAYLGTVPKMYPRSPDGGPPPPGQSWWDKRKLDCEWLTFDALRSKIDAVCAAYLAKLPGEIRGLPDPVLLGQDIARNVIEEDDGVIFEALWEAWYDEFGGPPSFELVEGWIRVTL